MRELIPVLEDMLRELAPPLVELPPPAIFSSCSGVNSLSFLFWLMVFVLLEVRAEVGFLS